MPAMFANVRRVMDAAGGSADDIIKMNVWITDRALRPIINKYWVEMFPDPHSRPARHTHRPAATSPRRCRSSAI